MAAQFRKVVIRSIKLSEPHAFCAAHLNVVLDEAAIMGENSNIAVLLSLDLF